MWSQFGFPAPPVSPVTIVAADERRLQPVTTADGLVYQLNTDRPIIPGTLEIDLNGLIQDPRDGDYEVNADLMSFTWKGVPLTGGGYSILTSFTIAP